MADIVKIMTIFAFEAHLCYIKINLFRNFICLNKVDFGSKKFAICYGLSYSFAVNLSVCIDIF